MYVLPDEVLLRIFTYVDCETLLVCRKVCKTWRDVASNILLWQIKLDKLLTNEWFVVACDEPKKVNKRLLDLIHTKPYRFYTNFLHHIPRSLDPRRCQPACDPSVACGSRSSESPLLPEFIPHWWNEDPRQLLFRSSDGLQEGPEKINRFAVFGSGLDHNMVSNMFAGLLQGTNGPFEFLQSFPGLDGYGGGVTLRVKGYSQIGALDTSMRTRRLLPLPLAEDCQSDESASPRLVTKNVHAKKHRGNKRKRKSESHLRSPYHLTANDLASDEVYQPKDLTFDLVLLYANLSDDNNSPTDEPQRIINSRLFSKHPDFLEEKERLQNLIFKPEIVKVLQTINGLIYVISQNITETELQFSRFELTTAIQSVSPKVPLVILQLNSHEFQDNNASMPSSRLRLSAEIILLVKKPEEPVRKSASLRGPFTTHLVSDSQTNLGLPSNMLCAPRGQMLSQSRSQVINED
ncbi:unnamed protein product [Calicophoron daubneyi]|uniref:F-box domain-containing protein n=1 Tax=Calicophoron daubneyi TaxID=300641 RepID=A0AAV2TWV2_CALDB